MGLQKYRFDRTGETQDNGSIPLWTVWIGGPSLAGVRNCAIDGDVIPRRTVYITGEPCSYFSQPAACRYKGQTVRGFVTGSDAGLVFCLTTDAKRKIGIPG